MTTCIGTASKRQMNCSDSICRYLCHDSKRIAEASYLDAFVSPQSSFLKILEFQALKKLYDDSSTAVYTDAVGYSRKHQNCSSRNPRFAHHEHKSKAVHHPPIERGSDFVSDNTSSGQNKRCVGRIWQKGYPRKQCRFCLPITLAHSLPHGN